MSRGPLVVVGVSALLAAATYLGLRPGEPVPLAAWPDPLELDSLQRYLTPVPATERLADQEIFLPAREAEELAIIREMRSASDPRPQPGWVLHAILVTDRSRHAIINDLPVAPGDTLPGGARVRSIEADQVTLTERGGATRVLRVTPGEDHTR